MDGRICRGCSSEDQKSRHRRQAEEDPNPNRKLTVKFSSGTWFSTSTCFARFFQIQRQNTVVANDLL
jgi:hypothetical protein